MSNATVAAFDSGIRLGVIDYSELLGEGSILVLLPPPRHSTPPYPIIRRDSKPTSTLLPPILRCYAQVTRANRSFDRGFGGWIFRHYNVLLCIPLFEAAEKTTSKRDKAGCGQFRDVTPSRRANRSFGPGVRRMHCARENTWPTTSSRSTPNAKFGPANFALHGGARA